MPIEGVGLTRKGAISYIEVRFYGRKGRSIPKDQS
jgi:hypothetical protein